jgi:hypothetical protein
VSKNRRTALAVRSIGVASAAAALALGVAGNAFACSITEFTPSASCDASGHGVISVLDKDGSHTAVDISILQGNNEIASQQGVQGSQQGVSVDFSVDWSASTTYTVKVVRSSGGFVGKKDFTTPDTACTPTDSTSSGGDNSTSSGGDNSTTSGGDNSTTSGGDNSTTSGGDNSTTSGGDNATTSSGGSSATGGSTTTTGGDSSQVSDANAPKPATGTSNLAETGGGSNTGMIAGIAGAFVVLGGGTVFMMRRRKPASQS